LIIGFSQNLIILWRNNLLRPLAIARIKGLWQNAWVPLHLKPTIDRDPTGSRLIAPTGNLRAPNPFAGSGDTIRSVLERKITWTL